MSDARRPLVGFDDRGRVFDAGEFILRVPHPARREQTLALLERYQAGHFEDLGIVETELAAGDELALRHRKLTISYPFEWPADMLKDAALFHLQLLSELALRGLTLKDALPGNVLFEGARPVFVDFFSLVPIVSLADEQWLIGTSKGRQPWQLVMERMFFPYFVVPLLAMAAADYPDARKMLAVRACNCSGAAPSWKDLLTHFRALLRYAALRGTLRGNVFTDVVKQLRTMLPTLDVTPRTSAYLGYYAAKKEEFDLDDRAQWQAKQTSMDAILAATKPATVLDLGANTGWFSRLAVRHGARVIATDIDEAAIDDLYLRARNEGLSILPLRLSFEELSRVVPCPAAEGMFLPATERLQSDLVCCLGLLHHLVLGEGRSLAQVLDVLSTLMHRTLAIEMIALDDPLVRENPSFFPMLQQTAPAAYNLDALLEAGRSIFRTATVMESHPSTRAIVVFEK
ncbi:MAG TPA: class I SAM-dependent methyltransferase [Thermoanaerobaculia bacterium]|nr:class I SAM-dependent methyltransferase [Thermoanaerobaculia bacterium]